MNYAFNRVADIANKLPAEVQAKLFFGDVKQVSLALRAVQLGRADNVVTDEMIADELTKRASAY